MTAPPIANPVFNSNDFEVHTSSGLDETMANGRYIRKTVDDATEYSLTIRNGIYCQSVDAPPDTNLDLALGWNADSITIGGNNAALVTTIHNAKTQGLLTAENGIQTSTLTSSGNVSIGGSLTSSGLIYANGGMSTNSTLINLGAPSGVRTALNLGFLKQNTFAAAITFAATGINKPLWNGEYTVGVWMVNIQLQFNVNAAVSNITIQLGLTLGGSEYGSVSQQIATTLQTTVCLSTVVSLAAITTLYVSGVPTYTGAAPNLVSAFSYVYLTRIG